MEFATFPKRFEAAAAERKDATSGLTSLSKTAVKYCSKILGTYKKKPSERKPKLHDRSFRPCDLNHYMERCKIMRIESAIDHDFDEFFDHVGGSSALSRQHAALPKRSTLSHGAGSRFESLPTSRSEKRYGRHGAKVAPYEAPASSAKYESGFDVVDASAHWIIKSRSQSRKRKSRRREPKTASVLLPPEVDAAVDGSTGEGDEHSSTGSGRRQRQRQRYSRLDDVLSKEHELYPVPPKLPTMKMRHKVDLPAYATAPAIDEKDPVDEDGDGEEEEAGEAGGGSGEVEEEEVEKLREIPSENFSSGRRRGEHVSSMVFGEEEKEKEGDGKPEEATSRRVDGEEEGDDVDEEDGKFVEFVEGVWDNSDRASVGMKLARQCFGFSTTSPTQKVISRAYFTVWITIVQTIIYFVIIGQYGIAPIGVDWTEQTADVLMTDLTIQHQSYMERPNLWIGPREADLIHLGAKFSPCIRPDKNIEALLEVDRKEEAATGCCVNNDGSGCVQKAKSECPQYLSTWNKSTVCGEDPKYCNSPRGPWGEDITTWPPCENSSKPMSGFDYHMMCEVVGRPCCVGVRGECVMATREYCDFRRGYFHENASLCSQVSCLNEVCGMIRFTDPKKPDQFYRFFTSLCIHPGLLALVITVVFQWLIQYDLERYIGWWSMASIYIVCGYCGSILSAIFIPYHVEAGPSGSQFGVLAAMSVEIVRWNAEEKPRAQLAIIVVFLLVLFLVGVIVPQVDNWAHLAGYVVGALLAVAFRPFEHLCGSRVPGYCRIVTRVMCFLWTAAIAAILTVVFCLIEVKQCHGCQYFNCIPFTETYCMGMGVNITSLSN